MRKSLAVIICITILSVTLAFSQNLQASTATIKINQAESEWTADDIVMAGQTSSVLCNKLPLQNT